MCWVTAWRARWWHGGKGIGCKWKAGARTRADATRMEFALRTDYRVSQMCLHAISISVHAVLYWATGIA